MAQAVRCKLVMPWTSLTHLLMLASETAAYRLHWPPNERRAHGYRRDSLPSSGATADVVVVYSADIVPIAVVVVGVTDALKHNILLKYNLPHIINDTPELVLEKIITHSLRGLRIT